MQSFPPVLPLRVVLCAIMLSACYGAEATGPEGPTTPDDPEEGRLVLVPKSDTLRAIGDTLRFTAGLVGSRASLQAGALKWRSLDPKVAGVDDRGMVIAKSAGTALIVVACGACSARADTASVTVDQSLTSVVVTPNGNTLKVGDTQRFEATALDPNGMPIEGAEFDWSSSDTDVVTVEDGLATAVGLGSATVAAMSEGKAGTARLTVSDRPVASVSVEPADTTIDRGRTAQLRATAFDANGEAITNASFGWSSSDPSVVTVDGEGLVHGQAVGSAKITASAGGESSSSDVTVVRPPVESIEVIPGSATIAVGESVQLDARAYDATGNVIDGISFGWSSSDGSVASVDGSGLTEGIAAGSATITASAEGKSGSSDVTVTSAGVDSVSVYPTSATIQVDSTVQLTATAYDSQGNVLSGTTFQWSSSNNSVATVDGNGLVKGIGDGTAKIRATAAGKSAEASITVDGSSPPGGGVLPAFPGAEGFGATALASCSRSSLEVLEVINLNKQGSGSLRDAISRSDPQRLSVIVFRVGGTIQLPPYYSVHNRDCLYIAGQTAPGDGIQLYNPIGFVLQVGNVQDLVVRYVRMRSGKSDPGVSDVVNMSSGDRVIFDHVSIQFGNDENFSIRTVDGSGKEARNVTLQRSIVAAGLRPHSTGSAISNHPGIEPLVAGISLHHNLYAHNSHRNPRMGGGMDYQVVNMVVYNWQNRVGGMDEGATIDYIRNYFKAGPWSGPGQRILEHGVPEDGISSLYLEGNVAIPKQPDPNADQTLLVTYDKRTNYQSLPSSAFRSSPRPAPSIPITTSSATEAYTSVLQDVGANARLDCEGNWVPTIDALDGRIINDVQAGTGPATSKEADHPDDYGGIPTLSGGTPCADTDRDGMPDAYEQKYGLDPADPSDSAGDMDGDGYANLEEYLAGSPP